MTVYVHFLLPEASKQALRAGLHSDETVAFGRDLPEAGRFAAFQEADVVFGNVPPEWLAQSARLRFVQLYSAGFDEYLPLDWAEAPLDGVTVANLRGFFGQPVAETAVAGLLSLFRKIDQLAVLQSRAEWVGAKIRPTMRLLHRQRALVLGAGAIGQQIQKILEGFDCEVTTISRRQSPTLADLDALLPSADVVLSALPDTPETSQIFNAERLARMKPGAVLVNVGRGSAVDEPALLDALRAQHLAGAVLDVTAEEPLPADHPLWQLPNVLLTQHTAGGYADEQADKVPIFLQNLRRFRAGEAVENRVDFGRGY